MGSSLPSGSVYTIVEMWREHPPASYSLKIHNFSQLENSTASSDDKYQSRFFSSGGYNWRLIVYPKGNEKDDGSGFISMYVEIDSTSLFDFTPPNEVSAELRFFVYNKKHNKYFTIQDAEVKRFNALKTVWGLGKVLPYDTFNDPKNGYVFEGGQCEFGVNVIVSPPLSNWEILSFDKEIPYPKSFLWTVKKFSELKDNVHVSNRFTMGGREWVLKLYPKGFSRRDVKWLSIFLLLADSDAPKADEKIFMQGRVRVLDPFGTNHFECQLYDWNTESNLGWCWDDFLSLAELRNSYLDKEDTLSIEIVFEVVSATKYSPII